MRKIWRKVRRVLPVLLVLSLAGGGWFIYDSLYTENAVPFLDLEGRHRWAGFRYDGVYYLATDCVLGAVIIKNDVGEDIKIAPRLFSKVKVFGRDGGQFDLEVHGSNGEGRLKLHVGIDPAGNVAACSGEWIYQGRQAEVNLQVEF